MGRGAANFAISAGEGKIKKLESRPKRVVEVPRSVFDQFRLRVATEPHHMQRTRIAVWISWRKRRV